MRRLFLTRVKVMNGAGGLWVRKFITLQPPLNAGGGLSADLEGSSLRTYSGAALRGTEELRSREALTEYRTSETYAPNTRPTGFSPLPSFQMWKGFVLRSHT